MSNWLDQLEVVEPLLKWAVVSKESQLFQMKLKKGDNRFSLLWVKLVAVVSKNGAAVLVGGCGKQELRGNQ